MRRFTQFGYLTGMSPQVIGLLIIFNDGSRSEPCTGCIRSACNGEYGRIIERAEAASDDEDHNLLMVTPARYRFMRIGNAYFSSTAVPKYCRDIF